jgi:hypothetical protein
VPYHTKAIFLKIPIKHFANGEVDLNRLFEVCKNIPGSARPVGGEVFIPRDILADFEKPI